MIPFNLNRGNAYVDRYGVLYSPNGEQLLKCKNKAVGQYTIKAGTKRICKWAFADCKSLNSIELPEGVISIGKGAFSNCKSLTSIELPKTLQEINGNPFSRCPAKITCKSPFFKVEKDLLIQENSIISVSGNPTSIIVPDYITSIGMWAFADCKSLNSIELPEGVISIGSWAFSWCEKLTSVKLPENLTSIGNMGFEGCKNLEKINIRCSSDTDKASVIEKFKSLLPVLLHNKIRVIAPPSNGSIDGHEYVDLGLSIKWATCNIGASKPEEYGDYFAWGETEPKVEYKIANCSTWRKNMDDISGNPDYDAARAKWGNSWRIPTLKEIKELVENCTAEWATINGVRGKLVTSKLNGNSIFLPAAGGIEGSSLADTVGNNGYYWSSSPGEGNAQGTNGLAFFDSGGFGCVWRHRSFGWCIRPITE